MNISIDIDPTNLQPDAARALARLVLTLAGVPVETVTVDGGDIRHLATSPKRDVRDLGEYTPPPAIPFEQTDPAAVFAPPSAALVQDDTGGQDDDASALYAAEGGQLPTTDKHGVPWDKRIHSTPATMTTGGEWRRKRGVQESLVNEVIAELKASGAVTAPQAPAATVTPVAPAAPPPPVTSASAPPAPLATPAPSDSSPTPPVAPSPPAAPETPPATADTPQMRFGRVMKKITAAQTAAKLSPTRPTEIAASLGLASVAALFSTGADQLDAFEALIDAEIA